MTSNFNDISHIESYLTGVMDAIDRKAFEARLMEDENLQQEVAAYKRILDGFQGLRENVFAQSVAQWTKETMENPKEAKIISIHRKGRSKSLRRNLAIAASIALLLGMTAIWWGTQQYTSATIVQSLYSPPLSSGTMGGDMQQAEDLEKTFELGHQFFQKNNYSDAAMQFSKVIGQLENDATLFDSITRKFYLENAKWNLLLAQFAAGNLSDEQLYHALNAIANDPSNEYADKALALQNKIRSFWRKLAK